MKNKNVWSLAAIALVLASCAKNEVLEEPLGGGTTNSSSLINFSASTGKVTRAAESDMTALKDATKGGFNVIALNKDEADIFVPAGGGTADNKYLWDATLNTNTGGWKWSSPTDEKKWPATGYPITFYTHFPINAAITKDNMKVDITIQDALANQVDLLAAKTQVDNHPLTGMAPLNFQHILSNVKFSILSKDGFKLYIQSIRIVNVAKEGRTYNYKTMGWEAAAVPSAHATAYTYCKAADAANILPITGVAATAQPVTATNGPMILLPQSTATAWDKTTLKSLFDTWSAANSGATLDTWRAYFEAQAGARIEITYRMEDAAGKSVVGWKKDDKYPNPNFNSGAAEGPDNPKELTAPENLYVRVGYPLNLNTVNSGTAWESGNRYHYIIALGTDDATNGTLLDPIFIKGDGTGTNPIITVNNPEVTPGGDITYSGHIMFDVNVSVWADSPSNGNGTPIN